MTTVPHLTSTQPPVLHMALQELLRLQAPRATLLAGVEGRVLCVRAGGVEEAPDGDLVPPDAWLERGELTWLTQGGSLLGLLWSEDGPPGAAAVQVLTLLLTAARQDGAGREADVLITQLPVPAAWLGADLTFRQVSRPFLDLLGLPGAAVVGQPLAALFPGQPDLASGLTQAAAGRPTRLPDVQMPPPGDGPAGPGRGLWLRGEARPYFGGPGAGVLWTLQDVTGEHQQSALLTALLDGGAMPAALLTPGGTVLHASSGLTELAPGGAGLCGTPLWTWPCFAQAPAGTVEDLVRVAAGGGAARARVPLAGGGAITLAVRQAPASPGGAPLLVVEGTPAEAGGWDTHAGGDLTSQVLRLGEHATLLLDHAGRTQLVSDRAAELVGLEAARLLGLPLTRVLGELGVRLHTPGGRPVPLPDLRALTLPLEAELLMLRPDGAARHLGVRVTEVGGEPGARPGLLLALRDLTALRRTQARLHHDARHDALTGLLNRAGLREALGAQDAPAGALLCLDLDGFSALNAALGRTACDHLLIGVAARLNDLAAGRGGLAARIADDTFALLLPGGLASGEESEAAVRGALAAPLRAGRRAVPVTFALGMAPAVPGEGTAALEGAEIALGQARRLGRGVTRRFRPALREQVAGDFRLEEALRGALSGEGVAEGQLALHFQPVLELASGRVVGAEALLRFSHPDLGEIPPADLLPLAARLGLAGPLGEWVVRRAAEGALVWRPGHPELRPSVNLSLEELRRPGGLGALLPALVGGVPDVEVGAGCLLDHGEETLGLLGRLRGQGAQVWVDDFGEGVTSLGALARFPLTGIKLHPTLTARLPGDARSVTLVEATLHLARQLGLRVTAVGVETPGQLAALRELGCDAAQGYAISAPLGATEFGRWLRAR